MPAARIESVDVVKDAIQSVTGLSRRTLDGETTLESLPIDERQYRDIWTEAARRRGVSVLPILTTMPVYACASEPTVWSLRWLSAVSAAARDALAANSVRIEYDTVDSLARSLDLGRWVGSGRLGPSVHTPMSRAMFYVWALIPFMLFPVGLWALIDAGSVRLMLLSLAPAVLGTAYNALPGLFAMRAYRRHREARDRVRA